VGVVRVLESERQRLVLSGSAEEQVAQAVSILADAGALGHGGEPVPSTGDVVPDGWTRGDRIIAVLVEPDRARVTRELLGAAARLAEEVGGAVTAIGLDDDVQPDVAGSWGADGVVLLTGEGVEEDVARAVGQWAEVQAPWAVLAPGTMWGREVASRVAARLGAGLTGDAVGVAVDDDRLVGWKPAFGGRLVAAITATSPVQMATVRAGILAAPAPRALRRPAVTSLQVTPTSRVRLLASGRDDDLDDLAMADAVVGVGACIHPDDYPAIEPLLAALGAELAATRKVTDRGWQPRARQVGITGRSLSPSLYVAVGVSGKFNHVVGVRGAGKILAINADATAPIFESADVGIVADWRDAVPLLAEAVSQLHAALD
jgi:electron transfer flavoprotein alpha subunit